MVARVATSTAEVRPGGARDWLARRRGGGRVPRPRPARPVVRVPPTSCRPGRITRDGFALSFWRHTPHAPERAEAAPSCGLALAGLHAALERLPRPPAAAVRRARRDRTASSPASASTPAWASATRPRAPTRRPTPACAVQPLHGDAHRRQPPAHAARARVERLRGRVPRAGRAGPGVRRRLAAADLAPFAEARAVQVAGADRRHPPALTTQRGRTRRPLHVLCAGRPSGGADGLDRWPGSRRARTPAWCWRCTRTPPRRRTARRAPSCAGPR